MMDGTTITYFAIAAGLVAVYYLFSSRNLETLLEKQKKISAETKQQLTSTQADVGHLRAELNSTRFKLDGTESLVLEKSIGFPWIRKAKAELDDIVAERAAQWLERKKHPAVKAAEQVRVYRKKSKEVEDALHRLRYRQEYCEHLFPGLADLFDEDISALIEMSEQRQLEQSVPIEERDDPVRQFISDVEYANFSPDRRNQLALDRYLTGYRTSWQIGRDFERFIGYELEKSGFSLTYYGAIMGLNDLGRDLIAQRNDEIIIVQCKYWKKDTTIHEKHIFQLYGTFCQYVIENNLAPEAPQGEMFGERAALSRVHPLFVTTGQLSDRSRKFADMLGVEYSDRYPSRFDYPRIKCNVSYRGNEKIYHLPFDQQYDRTRIEPHRGEFYAMTCQQAKEKGFRRAWRWQPENGD